MNNVVDNSKKIKKKPKYRDNNNQRRQNPNFNYKMNKNNTFYDEKPDFDLLAIKYSVPSVFINEHGMSTIDWKDHKACIELNKALLAEYYGIKYWTIPEGYLCPTITSRVNYLNWINDLLSKETKTDQAVRGLDIGTGASLIYPILGYKIYGWHFLGTDIDQPALNNAEQIIKENKFEQSIEVRKSDNAIMKNVIKEDEKFDFCMCNPPYFGSVEEKVAVPSKACVAKDAELATEGGEEAFISQMIEESKELRPQIRLFTTLVGRKINLEALNKKLQALKKELEQKQDDKLTLRIEETTFYQGKTLRWGLAWTFVKAD